MNRDRQFSPFKQFETLNTSFFKKFQLFSCYFFPSLEESDRESDLGVVLFLPDFAHFSTSLF